MEDSLKTETGQRIWGGQIIQKEYALFMHFDKIYAGICGYNRKTNKGNRPK
jgi:hypothetical protein